MAFLRRWLLILFALILGGGQILATDTREERAFAAAAAAFQDEVWARAETGFAQFRGRFPKSERLAEAVLFQAQAQFQQGKFTNAIALLADTDKLAQAKILADRYAYWTAEAQFAIGDTNNLAAAAETFVTLTKKFPESPLALSAVVEAGAAQEKLGNWAQLAELLGATNGVFQRAAALDAANELVSRGRLLLAQAKFTQQDFIGAEAVLNLLNPQTLAPKLEWRRDYLLGQVKSGAGDLEAAVAVTTNLLSVARSLKNAGWLADSVVFHGALLEKMGRLPEAEAAWSENLAADMPAEKQKQAVLKIAGLAAAQNDFTNAEVQLEKFLAQFADSPAAELALLTLGELHLQDFARSPAATNHLVSVQTNFDLVSAHTNFDRLIGGFTNSPLAGKAHLDRGWCFWLEGKFPESGADFQAALKLPLSKDLVVAKFKLGDSLFAQNNFIGARENYNAVLTEFAAFPAVASSLGDRALYQVLRASLELKDAPGAEAAMKQLLEVFPKSELVDNSLLLVVQGFSDFSSPAQARAVFQKYQQQLSASALLPQVELAVARTFEREQNWPAAIASYEDWLKKYPANAALPQVEYARGWAIFQSDDETNAFLLFTNFVAQFPADTNAPLAQWWVADHFFRAGNNWVGAETNYENIFQNPAWKGSLLIYPAQLMAGRAAVGRTGYKDAIHYFTELISDTNCPVELGVQARFAYGSALKQLDSPNTNRPFLNFETATNVFAQIYAANPTNETGALAWSEIGDCDLQLGALDAATNAYAQVVESPYAGAGLRSRAQVGLGMTLEKKAALLPVAERRPLLQLALDNYQEVFYKTNLRDGEMEDSFWMNKSGLQALSLASTTGLLNAKQMGKLVARLELLLPPLKDSLEKKREAWGVPKN
jgi:TolA-binding protein